MKHARKDYNRIQDPEHKIPEDEPVFLLRAQDAAAPDAVQNWCLSALMAGARTNIIDAARKQRDAMIEWQRAYGMKIPDMPEK